MSDWWSAAPVVEPKKPQEWWSTAPEKQKPYSGSVLPFTKGEDGQVRFDTNAGIIGAIKRAITLPGDAYLGKVDMRRPGEISDEPNAPDRVIERATDLAGLISPVNPAIRIGDRAIPGVSKAMEKRAPPPPTQQELAEVASKQYQAARDMGVDFSSQAIADIANRARAGLEAEGIISKLAPKTHGIIDELASPPQGSVAPLSSVEAARRAFGHAARDFSNPTEQLAAKRAMGTMDGFLNQPDPSSVVAGPATAAIDALTSARGNFAAAKRSETLSGISENANRRATTSNSGQNLDNSIRSRVASALERPKISGGFDDAERAALESVAQGTPLTNTARAVGNLLGGGGGMGAALTGAIGGTAGSAFGPIGIAAGVASPLVGWMAKRGANAMTDGALSKVAALTRTRSPLYQKMLEQTPMTPVSPEQRALIMRMLMQSTEGSPDAQGARPQYRTPAR